MVRFLLPLLLLGCSSPQTFPVRWSAALNLQELGQIEERLNRPVKFGSSLASDDDHIRMIKEGRILEVRTGKQWLSARKEGYEPKEGIDLFLSSWFNFATTLDRLRTAQSSKKSFVHDLSLDQVKLKDWPTELGMLYTSDDFRAAKGKVGWPDSTAKIKESGAERVVIEGEMGVVVLRWVASGDFNQDGVEDVLLEAVYDAVPGSLGYGSVFLISRNQKGQLGIVR